MARVRRTARAASHMQRRLHWLGDAPAKPVRKQPLAPRPLSIGAAWLTQQALLEVARPAEEAGWQRFANSRQIAWKTGTSWGLRDAWAVGSSTAYTVGVWAGNADGTGVPGLTGGTAAAPLLFALHEQLPQSPWYATPLGALKTMQHLHRRWLPRQRPVRGTRYAGAGAQPLRPADAVSPAGASGCAQRSARQCGVRGGGQHAPPVLVRAAARRWSTTTARRAPAIVRRQRGARAASADTGDARPRDDGVHLSGCRRPPLAGRRTVGTTTRAAARGRRHDPRRLHQRPRRRGLPPLPFTCWLSSPPSSSFRRW